MSKIHPIVPVTVVLSLMSAPGALQASFPPERGELYVAAQARNLRPHNRKALHIAAAAGDVDGVKRLVDKHPDRINVKDSRGLAPLHEAAREGHADVVRVLLAAGTNPNDATTYGNQTPLHLAAGIGSVEVCKALLEGGAELWLRDEDDTTAMGAAIQGGHVEIVKLLADANVRRLSRPIFHAIFNLVLPLHDGLHFAASSNNIEIMKILLENRKIWTKEKAKYFRPPILREDIFDIGDNVNGNTALHIAAYNGYTEIARLLVQAGADVMAQNRDDKTPLDLAHEQGHGSLAQMLEQVPKLLEAAAAGRVEAVKRLIDEEQSINVKHPGDGYTPLHEAARRGDADVIQVLLAAGADIYLKDKNNRTALDIALEEGHTEIAKTLINAGGLINRRTKETLNKSPLP